MQNFTVDVVCGCYKVTKVFGWFLGHCYVVARWLLTGPSTRSPPQISVIFWSLDMIQIPIQSMRVLAAVLSAGKHCKFSYHIRILFISSAGQVKF